MKDKALAEAKKCVKCGKCRAKCPTFLATGDEGRVARGRIMLIEAVLSGKLKPGQPYFDALDTCQKCLRCKNICPAGVKYDIILDAARSELRPSFMARFVFRRIIPFRSRFNFLITILKLAQKFLPRAEQCNTLRFLPLFYRGSYNLPRFARRSALKTLPENTLAEGKIKSRVALFLGCLVNYVYPEIASAALEVLSKAGVEVVIPKGQTCCGSPALSVCDRESAIKLARINAAAIDSANVDAVITLCATGGRALKQEYPVLLGEEGTILAAKTFDFAEYLADKLNFVPEKSGLSVSYHDACHLRYGQGIEKQPRALLAAAADYEEMEGSDLCCGAGGLDCSLHEKIDDFLTKEKIKFIKKCKSGIIAAGCPGCILHLNDRLAEKGINKKVAHTAEILAQKISE